MLKSVLDFFSSLFLKPLSFYRSIKKGDLKKKIQEQVLRTQDSNVKMATAIGFGIFMSIFPIWGFQMLVAIFLAAFFRLNKVIVLIAANISIPPIIPLLLHLSFLTGGFLLNQSSNINFSPEFDFANIKNDLFQYYIGAVIFASVVGLFSGLISYILLMIFRKEIITEKASD